MTIMHELLAAADCSVFTRILTVTTSPLTKFLDDY